MTKVSHSDTIAALAERARSTSSRTTATRAEELVVARATSSYDDLLTLVPAIGTYWPDGFSEPRIRASIHVALDLDVYDGEAAFVLLVSTLRDGARFTEWLSPAPGSPIGVRLRAASVVRAMAVGARSVGLDVLAPGERQATFFTALARLCRDRHAAVGLRAAYAVGLLERDHPELEASIGLHVDSPMMARRRMAALAARWVVGEVDDDQLLPQLQDRAADAFVRATGILALRLGLRDAPESVVALVRQVVAGASDAMLSALLGLSAELEDERVRESLVDAVMAEARGGGRTPHPAVAPWLDRSAAVEAFGRLRRVRTAAAQSPRVGAGEAAALVRHIATIVESDAGPTPAVQAMIDAAFFDSTLVRDAAVAGAGSAQDARRTRRAWATTVAALRDRREVAALAPSLAETERRERLRGLVYTMDALADGRGDDRVSFERVDIRPSLLVGLLDLARPEEPTAADRLLAIALAICFETEIGAGSIDAAGAFLLLSQQPPRFFRHLAAALTIPELARALECADDLARVTRELERRAARPRPSRGRIDPQRRTDARSLLDVYARLSAALLGLGAVGDHPLAAAYEALGGAASYLLRKTNPTPAIIELLAQGVAAMGRDLAHETSELRLRKLTHPKVDAARRKLGALFAGVALAHEVDAADAGPWPVGAVLGAAIPLRGHLGDEERWEGIAIGDYMVVECLGKGGMGWCLLARQRSDKARTPASWVLKLPRTDVRARRARDLRSAFREEAMALLELASKPHPSIVNFASYHERGYSSPFLVMSHVPGESLASRIARQTMTLEQAVRCAAQLAEALAHAHARGVAHLDVKPENIILRTGDDTPVLVDWGLAGARPGWGTPTYMSPERFDALGRNASRQVTLAGDVFALGLVLAETLVGHALLAEPITAEDNDLLPGIKAEYDQMQEASWRAVFACQTIACSPALLDVRVERAFSTAPAPLKTLVRSMLREDPRTRVTAARAAEGLGSLGR